MVLRIICIIYTDLTVSLVILSYKDMFNKHPIMTSKGLFEAYVVL